jgi:hypothetical protein
LALHDSFVTFPPNSQPRRIDEIFLEVQQLSTQEKAELVNRILSRDSGLCVMLGNNQLLVSGSGLVNMMDDEYLPDMIDAIAAKLRDSLRSC